MSRSSTSSQGAAKQRARRAIADARQEVIGVSHRIHARPELAFEEFEAVSVLTSRLSAAGFDISAGIGDIETAFEARVGTGELHIALLAEYDALPGIGHACGHNIISAAAYGASVGLAPLVDDLGLTLHVFGTPGEEIGNAGGKVILLERGAFDGVHAVLMVHPSAQNVLCSPFYAVSMFDIRYLGHESHAAMYPELGVNAADAFTIAQTAIGLLRQHLLPTDRVHGVITNGGAAANVVPGETRGRYMVRARTLEELEGAKSRVMKCFEAGAVGTGCSVEVLGGDKPYAEVHHDEVLAAAFGSNWNALGHEFPHTDDIRAGASTDLGNLSRVLPAIHPLLAIGAPPGVVNHQPAFAEFCATPTADSVAIDGAVALAWTVVDAALDPATRSYLLAGQWKRRQG